jgi:hypothetical protein
MPTFPAFDLSKFALPKFDVSKFDLPRIQAAVPHVDSDRVVGLARDVAYAGIGLTVLAVQQADHGRRTLQDAVTRGARKVAEAVA